MAQFSLDDKDKQILHLLERDARISFVELGKKVKLSEGAVRRRVHNFVKSGVISRFTIQMNQENKGASAIALVSASPATVTPLLAERLKKLNAVETVYEITGQYDVAAIISASNIAEVNRCVDEIRRLEGAVSTNTVIILRTIR